MIPIPPAVRVWIATGHTDMRRGMNSLALLVQEAFKRDPHGGDLYVFRGKNGKLIKILWHDGLGMSLYAKRLERGRFLWPSSADGVVTITPAQLGYLLEGIDWRMPQHTWRPQAAGSSLGFEKLTIKKLRHEQFGQSSERGALLDQLELQLADLEENAAQAETAEQQ